MASRTIDEGAHKVLFDNADEDVGQVEPHAITCMSVVRHGIGLATDLYDLTIINAIRPELEDCYGRMSDHMNGAITSATSAGAMVGQLAFGMLADRMGRRPIFITTACLLCFSAAGSAMAMEVGSLGVYEVLLIWRFLLGIGIGGEYPLSMAVTAEGAGRGGSGKSMALTYMMFQVGQLLAPIMALLCLFAGFSSQLTWRLCLGTGSVLALFGTLVRARTMQESQVWLDARAKARTTSILRWRTLRAVGFPLLGTTATYFLYDVVAWGVGSYTSSIFESDTRKGTLAFLLLMNFMATPGFLLTLLMDRYGRRNFQLLGFLGMGLCLAVVGLSYGAAPQVLLVLMFGVQKIFDSAGPGATTFVIPGEIFPTVVRASCHGASAAAGKLGAFVGMYCFPVLQSVIGYRGTLILGGGIMLIGMLFTAIFTPPYTNDTLRRLQEEADDDICRTTEILWARTKAEEEEDEFSDSSNGTSSDDS